MWYYGCLACATLCEKVIWLCQQVENSVHAWSLIAVHTTSQFSFSLCKLRLAQDSTFCLTKIFLDHATVPLESGASTQHQPVAPIILSHWCNRVSMEPIFIDTSPLCRLLLWTVEIAATSSAEAPPPSCGCCSPWDLEIDTQMIHFCFMLRGPTSSGC